MEWEFEKTAVNAKENKQSFNITVDHRLNEHVTMSASYSHMKDKWLSKGGWILDPNWGYSNSDDINVAINSLRPRLIGTLVTATMHSLIDVSSSWTGTSTMM
ncbi:MAG: hypothetical protein E7J76_04990 [Veillonella parvula]|nr:hypothetical protein [Veillonella parvula]